MDYKEKATILRVCSSKKGERCSRCPAFGQGNQNCMRNAMKDGATAITDLLARAEAAEAENAALRKMQPIQLDDTGAQALTLAAEVSELRKKLEAYEATGLEPEDLKKPFDEEVLLTMTARMMGITPDRLRELVEADHDGRCFITGRPYPVTGKAADDKITGWVKDGFYCHICKKRHERAIKKTVYLSKEAALKGEQDG